VRNIVRPICRAEGANWIELAELFWRIVKILTFLTQMDVPGIDEVSGPAMFEIFLFDAFVK
jgi:hypothetical protein